MWHYHKTPKKQENSCGTMWRYVALSQKQLNHQKRPKLQFWKKRAVALCSTIKKHQKRKKTAVALCGTMWHYVALCATMWRYVALSQKQLNNQKQQKLQFWKKRAVALCGTIKNHQKSKKTAVALCGAMWHYPKNSLIIKNGQNCNFGKKELWHYVALSKNTKNARKQLWHYVALCGTIPKTAKS